MTYREEATTFSCGGKCLVGVVAVPARALGLGVVIVVGGPQYRVGSHRQFVHLSRYLAARGIACLRFDFRGMGDSEGEARDFEHVGDDIRAAIDAFHTCVPGLASVALWGLCDGAAAACFHAVRDARVAALVLVNPWVRTAEGEARAIVQQYYRRRLMDREFWGKLFRGGIDLRGSVRSLLKNLALAGRDPREGDGGTALALPQRVARCIERFRGPMLIVLSGNDLTAAEFDDASRAVSELARALAAPRVERRTVEQANHTFSSAAWKGELAETTFVWLRGLMKQHREEIGNAETVRRS